MSLAQKLRRKPKVTVIPPWASRSIEFNELVNQYEIVNVARDEVTGNSYIVVCEREESLLPSSGEVSFAGDWERDHSEFARWDSKELTAHGLGSQGQSIAVHRESGQRLAEATKFAPQFGEIGSSSPSPFTGWLRREYNPKLLGIQGLRKYDEMRKSDGAVRGSLRLYKTPVLGGRWYIDPQDTSKPLDVKAANVMWWNLVRGMSITWPQVLTECLLCVEFGYYMFEQVWDYLQVPSWLNLNQEYLGWSKLAPRHPMDVEAWQFDPNGGPSAVVMNPPTSMPTLAQPFRTINIDKLMVFTFDREAGNIEGISALRSMYKHWYFKDQLYKIDAIQKERHGIGIPVIKLPVGFDPVKDRAAADELGRNLRTNERAHVVLPPNWELLFAKMEGHPVDALKSVEHHNEMMRESMLVRFQEGNSAGAVDAGQGMMLKATRFLADIVRETFNNYGIKQLHDANFLRAGQPELCVRRIGEEEEQRTASFTIRNMVGARVILPDDKLEAHVRDLLDLPEADPETARFTNVQERISITGEVPPGMEAGNVSGVGNAPTGAPSQPGAPGAQVGLPRQQPTPPAGPPRSNAGTDRSGG
jgi:hypothetical protein